jgi:hypothetical protein
MKSLLIVSALSLSVCSAIANDNKTVKPLLGFGLTGGGETLVSARYTNGDNASIRSGGLVSFIGGAEFRVADNIAVQTTIGYHVDRVNAANGSVRFERFPLSVTGLYRVNQQVRLGLGLEHVSNPKIRGTGVASSASENFKSSTGLALEAEYLFNTKLGVKLRAVQHKFKSKDFNGEVDGNYFGVFGTYYF